MPAPSGAAKDKIIVVAHSLGALLGLGMVRPKPDLFYAYVGTAQVADEAKNYSTAYDALLQKAKGAGYRKPAGRRGFEERRPSSVQQRRRV